MPKNSVRDWDTTSTANTDVGGTGINEGCDPGNINDAIRKVMAQTAEWFGDTNGSLVSGGSASAYTLTTNEGVTAYAQGMVFMFEANHASTGASTLAVDGLAAKAIKKRNDVALAAGDIEAGQIVMVAYEAAADAFQMLSQVAAQPSNAVLTDTTKNLTVGYTNTAHDYGTISSGTVTVDFTEAPQAYYTNGGAHTLAPDSGVEGAQDILITNNASAGAITTTGFTVLGDSFDTTDGNKFLAQVRRINGEDLLIIAALQ